MSLKFGSLSPDYTASHSTREQVPEKQLFVSQLSRELGKFLLTYIVFREAEL